MDITAPIQPPEQKRRRRRGGFLLRFLGFMFAASMIVFVAVGALKFAAHSVYVRIFDEIGLGQSFRYLTGVMGVGGGVLLLIPAVGSVYPLPPAPVLYFPYAFLVYLAVGVAWILTFYGRKPTASETVREDLDKTHASFMCVTY